MKIKPIEDDKRIELSVVPLVNVVFLLLVFFMLVGRVAPPEPLDIRPPESVSGGEPGIRAVRVLVTREGHVAIDRAVVSTARLTERVVEILSQRPVATFQIKADAGVEAVRMIEIMESLRAAGVEHLTLITERSRSR